MPESLGIHTFFPTVGIDGVIKELVKISHRRRCRIWHHVGAANGVVSIPFVDEESLAPGDYQLGPDEEELCFSMSFRCRVDKHVRQLADPATFFGSGKKETAAIGPVSVYIRSDVETSRIAFVPTVTEDIQIMLESRAFNSVLDRFLATAKCEFGFMVVDDEYASLADIPFANIDDDQFASLEEGGSVDAFLQNCIH